MHQSPNIVKRKSLKSLAKAAIASGVAVAGGGSFNAMAFADPWTEIARGIATGIARFTQISFKQFSDWWATVQKENDDKTSIAKGHIEDSRIDFRTQIENLKRINRIKPTSNLCNTEGEAVEHQVSVEQEKAQRASTPIEKTPASAVISNESARRPNRGVTYLGNDNGRFNPKKLIENLPELNAKVAKREALTQAELAAYSKITMGRTAAECMEPLRQIAMESPDIINNPTISDTVSRVSVKVAAMSYATQIYTQTITSQAGNFVMLDQVEKQALKKIENRYADQEYKMEIGMELNEVALTAEYLKLLGENIYAMNAQYRLNQKIMAALAMQILVNDQDQS